MKCVLSIAGSDCSGGAGIQADLKTFIANRVYGMSAVTALTAQNTCGVRAISEVDADFMCAQIDAVFEDIVPHAVKIGMVPSAALAECIARRLVHYRAENIVVDPVMVATAGDSLMRDGTAQVLCQRLLPIAALTTPNIPEAQVIAEMRINSEGDMERAAARIRAQYGCAVLVKGGHRVCDASDYLLCDSGGIWLRGKRIENPNTHGTGCTLSSAIAANLAKGMALPRAVEEAKAYLTRAIAAMLDLGRGSGPLDHRAGWEGQI